MGIKLWAVGPVLLGIGCGTSGNVAASLSSTGGTSGVAATTAGTVASKTGGATTGATHGTSHGATGTTTATSTSTATGTTTGGGTTAAAAASTTTTHAATTASTSSSSGATTGSSGADWPSYLHDVERTGFNANETTLSPVNAINLQQKWSFTTADVIEASAVVSNGVLYIGSWDGNEYALDPVSGALLWQTFIDTTTIPAGCNAPWPDTQGVSSTATVQDGTVYVGGGADDWYALSAADGGVIYKIYSGDSSSNGGFYNWASPLIADGNAYINLSSAGNCPSVQGAVLQVSLATQALTANVFDAVPSGQVGGAIWNSPAYDAATHKVFVSTGSVEGVFQDSDQPYAQAIVALDANTLALLDSWQLPQAQDTGDSDFGASPTLFTDANARQLVGAASKNGYFYALDRNNLDAGPVWEAQLAIGGGDPESGEGSIAAAAFDGTAIYVAAGNTTLGENAVTASITAFDPATGTMLWQQAAPGVILGSLAAANGLLVDASGDTLEVRQTSDGTVLFSAQLDADPNVTLSASPSIANGFIYEGSGSGVLYAFGL